MYEWTITHDFIAEPEAEQGTNLNAVGVFGPRGAKRTHEEIAADPNGKKFRMFDDDGELYYEGILVGGDGFEPLDDFGSPNAGATAIKYKENGVWVML
jgi:hypothetical protein